MAKNYFDRYIWLINLIDRYGYISFEEIDRAWIYNSRLNKEGGRLPERTFFNHIKAIEEVFGLRIKCDRSLGYYIANSEDMEDDGIRQWMLNFLSLNNMLNESRGMRDKILFEEIPSSQRWLTALLGAIKDGKTIEMTYQGFNSDAPSTFEAHPWCLKLFRQRWYLLARGVNMQDPWVYGLDRIRAVNETKNPLKVPKKFKADEFFSQFFGIFINKDKPETIHLKVDASQVGYFESLPLHGSQRMIEQTDGYTIYEYKLVPTFDFEQEILRNGPNIEVLSPASFRDTIHADAKAMLALYE
jgi:hypothetical protein